MQPIIPLQQGPRPEGSGLASIWRKPRYYWRVYSALWRNSVVREMNFKANFLLWIFVETLWFGLQLSFCAVIYRHTDSIGSWSKWEVILLVGASHLIQQLFQAVFLVNCSLISDLVRTGKFDFMLLFPINTRFLISLKHVDLGGFFSAGTGLAVMIYAAKELQLSPSWAQLFGFAVLCGAAVLIHYSIMFLMGVLSFWTTQAQGMVMAYYNLFSIARIPDAAFRGGFRVMFTFFIPVLVVVCVPVKVLTEKLSSPGEGLLMLALSFGCFLASSLVWRLALGRYTSASS